MNFIELLVLIMTGIVTLLGGLWSMFTFYDGRQENRVRSDRDMSLQISELQVKVLRIEQDLSETTKRHNYDFVTLRKDLMSSLAEFKAENRNTNSIILTKLDTHNEILIRFSTSFENHLEDHSLKGRVKKPLI